MIIFKETDNDVDKALVSAFKHYEYNSQAHDELILGFIDHIANAYKGKYAKEDLIAAFNKMYKRNVSFPNKKNITKGFVPDFLNTANRAIQDSDPNSYEASPGIIKRLYSPRLGITLWSGYLLNKYEQDIVSFVNTNNHSKMDSIRKKPAFSSLSNKLIKNAPIQKILYRKENLFRASKVGDIISFNLRSFSTNPHHLTMAKFTKGQGQEVMYRAIGLRGINIGVYDDFTNLSMYEDEYLCTGRCKVTAISKNRSMIVIDARTV